MTTYRKKVILNCIGDTELNQWYPDTNYGSRTGIKILRRWQSSPINSYYYCYSLFKFETLPDEVFEKVEL
uniref:hypothetical protein n=1 Tax=Acinetobacter sp. TaxID=472 RepID=UPI003D08AA62